MYKWGFFFLLGFNCLLLAKGIWDKPLAKQRIEQLERENVNNTSALNDKLPTRSMKKARKRKYFNSKQSQLSLIEKMTNNAKQSLFEEKIEELEGQFEYFFTYNNLSTEDLYQIKLAMIRSRQGDSMQCFPTNDDELYNSELNEILGENLSVNVITMMEQEWIYNEIQMRFNYKVDHIENMPELVNELYELSQQERNILFAEVNSVGLDDEFEEDEAPFGEEDEKVLTESLLKEKIIGLDQEYFDKYQKFLGIYERHSALTLEIKFDLLNDVLSDSL
jgi:hypothetical protein